MKKLNIDLDKEYLLEEALAKLGEISSHLWKIIHYGGTRVHEVGIHMYRIDKPHSDGFAITISEAASIPLSALSGNQFVLMLADIQHKWKFRVTNHNSDFKLTWLLDKSINLISKEPLYYIETADRCINNTVEYIGTKVECEELLNPYYDHPKFGGVDAHIVKY